MTFSSDVPLGEAFDAVKAYINATKVMAARGWRRHEPINREAESPQLLQDALDHARQRGITADQIRREAAIPQDLFAEVLRVISDVDPN